MKKIFAAALLAASAMSLGACTQIDDGTVGLRKVYGEVEDTPIKGFQWYEPWSTDILVMDTTGQKMDSKLTTPTADIQQITVESVATVSLIPGQAAKVYRAYNTEWKDRVVPQLLYSVQKNEIGRWRAVDIIAKRSIVEANIQNELTKQLLAKGIRLDEYSLTGTSFSEAFMDAVEAKEIAVQKGIAAKNNTVKIQEEANQAVISAEGEAKAMQAKAAAASNPLAMRLRELEVQELAIKTWNGDVPSTVMGGNGAGVPFINVPLNGSK